jgi:type II secretory pathway component PulK
MNPVLSTRSVPRRARGSVVIFVLGVILLATFLMTRLMDRAAVELAAENKAVRRSDLRQEAISALEASLAVLADFAAVDGGLRDPADGWEHPLELIAYAPSEGTFAEVSVADETGRLSLPQADDEELARYLEAIGCPPTATDSLVDALLTWTKPDHISLDGDGLEFPSAALPYNAPQRPLRSFEELRAIPAARELFFDGQGRWNELGLRFKSGVSLFSFPATNVNTAGVEPLLASGLDRDRIAAIADARRAHAQPGAAYRSPAELAGAWGREGTPPGLGTEATCLRLDVQVRQGGRSYRLDAWIARGGSSGAARAAPMPNRNPAATVAEEARSVRNNPRKRLDYPFQILELRENDGT